MIIYRIENIDQSGPYYVYRNYSDWSDRDHANNDKTPCPEEDGIEEWPLGHRCGFTSLEKLKAWFTHEEPTFLAGDGFLLSIYDVPESSIKVGFKQVIFILEDATLVNKLPIGAGHEEIYLKTA